MSTSCRERLADFSTVASHEGPATDVAAVCAAACGLDTLPVVATRIDDDDSWRPRPWLERHRGQHNLPDGVSPADALQCMGLVGVAGCTFESPLEAAWRALRRTFDANDPAYGFLRDDAALFVLFVTDEGDCSVRPEHLDVFDPSGERTFWAPGSAVATSAVCWDAAVACVGGPGEYEDCPAMDQDRDGNPSDGNGAVLHPIDRYVDLLAAIEREKQEATSDSGPRVFTHVLGGVPEGYEHGGLDVSFVDALDPALQTAFGIGPACMTETATAVPPARLREVTAAFPEFSERTMFSVCGEQWQSALACVPGYAQTVRRTCVDGCVADADPSTPESLEPDCAITIRRSSDPTIAQRIPDCVDGELPPGASACVEVRAGADLDQICSDQGANLQVVTFRGEQPREGGCVEIVCRASDDPDVDCPNA